MNRLTLLIGCLALSLDLVVSTISTVPIEAASPAVPDKECHKAIVSSLIEKKGSLPLLTPTTLVPPR
jgi:hypothetical protein